MQADPALTDAIRAEAEKTKETADRVANREAPEDKDDVRVLAGMVRQLAEQVERLATAIEGTGTSSRREEIA